MVVGSGAPFGGSRDRKPLLWLFPTDSGRHEPGAFSDSYLRRQNSVPMIGLCPRLLFGVPFDAQQLVSPTRQPASGATFCMVLAHPVPVSAPVPGSARR